MQGDFPAGTLTLIFTDIEGSSELWEKHRDNFWPILELHNRVIRAAVLEWRGHEVKTQGDSFMLAFQDAGDAVRCALDIQRSFEKQEWPAGKVLVRVGMHTASRFWIAMQMDVPIISGRS